MTLHVHTATGTLQARTHLAAEFEQLGEAAGGAVLLLPSFQAVDAYRKAWAGRPFMFGLTVTTLFAWATERFALCGDGRTIVSPLQRKLLMHAVLEDACAVGNLKQLQVSPGTVDLLTSLASEALPYFIGEEPPHVAVSLTEAEREVCQVLTWYAQALDQADLCETTQALEYLRQTQWPTPTLFCADIDEFSAIEQAFLDQMAQRTKVVLVREESTREDIAGNRASELAALQKCLVNPQLYQAIQPTGAVQFLLPAGPSAAPLLLAQSLVQYAQAGHKSIAVAVRDPRDVFERIAPFLYDQGIHVTVTARMRLGETDFGQMWTRLVHFLEAQQPVSLEMSDVILGSLSDISHHKAYELDALWRGDRTTTRQACLEAVMAESEFFGQLIPVLQQKNYPVALDCAETFIKQQFMRDEVYRAEQLTALNVARDFYQALTQLAVQPQDILGVLMQATVAFAAQTPADEDYVGVSVQVDCMSLENLSGCDPLSYETVVLSDLDAASYPLKEKDDAASRLFEKFGITQKGADTLFDMRREFLHACAAPSQQLVCLRVLNTADGSPDYPAIMLEELLDCYRDDPTSFAGVDALTGLPESLAPFAQSAGEDALYENLALSSEAQSMQVTELLPSQGCVSKNAQSKIILPAPGEVAGAPARLSPSAIESYIECPYKWFSLRRLRLNEVDAGFGALEMGSFTHNLLKEFYLTFQKQGALKVTQESLPAAQALLGTLFEEHLAHQDTLRKNENPLIPLTALEKEDTVALKKRLLRYLEREVELLPGFTPRYFEYSFGRNTPFEYGGCHLHGSIDRIDVNEKGQAVVIDYKSSVSTDYQLDSASDLAWTTSPDGEDLILPHKVQALLYAQAVRRELGLEVVGAVYVSYGRKPVIAGAYDQRVLGPLDFPGMKTEACGTDAGQYPSFSDFLDTTEQLISCALKELMAGFIEPHPHGSDPCGFCPVTACKARR